MIYKVDINLNQLEANTVLKDFLEIKILWLLSEYTLYASAKALLIPMEYTQYLHVCLCTVGAALGYSSPTTLTDNSPKIQPGVRADCRVDSRVQVESTSNILYSNCTRTDIIYCTYHSTLQ